MDSSFLQELENNKIIIIEENSLIHWNYTTKLGRNNYRPQHFGICFAILCSLFPNKPPFALGQFKAL